MQKTDLTLPAGDGIVNIRVGAIILKDGKLLMAGNPGEGYLYTVGGRVQFGESIEEAIRREVREETGAELEIDRLGFVHEDFFRSDNPAKLGKTVYELAFFFYMKTPPDFEPVSRSFAENGQLESLTWIDPQGDYQYYPEFFRTELARPVPEIRHIVTRDL